MVLSPNGRYSGLIVDAGLEVLFVKNCAADVTASVLGCKVVPASVSRVDVRVIIISL